MARSRLLSLFELGHGLFPEEGCRSTSDCVGLLGVGTCPTASRVRRQNRPGNLCFAQAATRHGVQPTRCQHSRPRIQRPDAVSRAGLLRPVQIGPSRRSLSTASRTDDHGDLMGYAVPARVSVWIVSSTCLAALNCMRPSNGPGRTMPRPPKGMVAQDDCRQDHAVAEARPACADQRKIEVRRSRMTVSAMSRRN